MHNNQTAPPNALQGFSQNRGKPIKITSVTLERHDKDKIATFSGDVHLVQGDTTTRSKTLVVFYDDDAPASPGTPKRLDFIDLRPNRTAIPLKDSRRATRAQLRQTLASQCCCSRGTPAGR
jgi:lipopolysaccharide export system protein LptA